MAHARDVLVAIPMYNEAANIARVIGEVRAAMPEAELLVVADGPTDGSPDIVDGLRVRQVRLPCNLGYTRALQTAVRYAIRERFRVLVTVDADGQHRPADIPGLVAALETEGADVVIGSRFVGGRNLADAPLARRVGMQLFSWITTRTLGRPIHDTTSGFRAYRAAVLPHLLSDHFVDMHAEALIFLGKLGHRIVEHPVEMNERTAGVSMYTWASALWYPLQTLLLIAVTLIQIWRLEHHRAT